MADHVKMKRITILFLAATQLQIDKNHGIKDLLPFVGRISEHLQQPSMPLFWAAVGTRTSFRPQSVGKYWEQRQKDCIRRINPPSSEKPIVEGNLCSQCIYPAFEVIPFSGTSCPPKPATEQPARPPPPPSLVALSQPSLPSLRRSVSLWRRPKRRRPFYSALSLTPLLPSRPPLVALHSVRSEFK